MRRLLAMLALSFGLNALLGVVFLGLTCHDARVFKVMRIISSETRMVGIIERLGTPQKVYSVGEADFAFPKDAPWHSPRIKRSVYQYDTPEIQYFIYVDENGFVDNIRCKPPHAPTTGTAISRPSPTRSVTQQSTNTTFVGARFTRAARHILSDTHTMSSATKRR